MKYFITFETKVNTSLFSEMSSTAEYTWSCEPGKLQETLDNVAKNKHKVIRIIFGQEIKFTQRVVVEHTLSTIPQPTETIFDQDKFYGRDENKEPSGYKDLMTTRFGDDRN